MLVTFAVDAEFAPWRRSRKFAEIGDGPCRIYTERSGDLEINVMLTGIAGRSSWWQTAKTAWRGGLDICVSSGLAGALRANHPIGQVLAAKKVYSANWSKTVVADEALMEVAGECGAQQVESFYSADHVVLSASEKQELGKRSDAVEMESGVILSQAAELGARCIAIRGISDGAQEDMPLDFNRVTTASGQVSIPRIVGEVAMHPKAIPTLIRFGQQSRMAAKRLTEFLDRYMEALAKSSKVRAKEMLSS
ncbi:MAG: hypothetical protein WBR26_17615 [Candidatus Acidiferrum sp.]